MHHVCVTDHLAPPPLLEQRVLRGLARVECLQARTADELAGRVDRADALIVFHEIQVPARIIRRLDRCRVIVRGGVGFDNVDIRAAGRRGIVVCNVPDYGVDEVADHALALMLACNRGLWQTERQLRRTLRPWDKQAVAPVRRLSGATFGVVGLGRIGSATALRAKALRMRVIACDPYLRPGLEKSLGVERVDLPALLRESDVVSLHTPLTDETRHLIDRRALRRMKRHALLINTARGAVVDVEALADALDRGWIGGAGIDVLPVEPVPPDSRLIRLWQRDDPPVNLVITPHTAFYSESGSEEMRIKAAQEIARVLRGQPPLNCVNAEFLRRRS